jgi:hypothetical protein
MGELMKPINIMFILILIGSICFAEIDFTKVKNAGEIYNTMWGSHGLWEDLNNDGKIDIVITRCNGNEATINSLFWGNGNGTFTKLNKAPFTSDRCFSHGIFGADYNNDGFLDIFLANRVVIELPNITDNNFLYKNNGNGTFSKILSGDIFTDLDVSAGAAWADIDNDGNLDLFVCNPQGQDVLYFNNGDGTFSKTTNIIPDSYWSTGACFCDYNEDGLVDVIVASKANLTLPNKPTLTLIKNYGNNDFRVVENAFKTNDEHDSFRITVFDFDNDGDLDVLSDSLTAFPNKMFINQGNDTFTEYTKGTLHTDYIDQQGATWGDYDNDGDIDLYFRVYGGYHNFLYKNENGLLVRQTTGTIVTDGLANEAVASRFVDLNNDGFLDLSCVEVKNAIYLNNADNGNHWIKINVKGILSNASAIGAKIKVTATINGKSITQYRQICSDGLSNLQLHFGLAKATTIARIWVKWPSGVEKTMNNVKINQTLTISEPMPTVTNAQNLNLERLKSDMVFFYDFVNRLSWTDQNPYHIIDSFEIYRKPKNAGDDQYALLYTLTNQAGVKTYDDKFFKADELFTYKIITVTTQGRKSSGVVVSN